MKERIVNDIEELPLITFLKTLDMITKKPGNKYNFITKSGESLKWALFNLFQIIWRTKRIPKGWYESTLTQI